jgi:hypothetical protein
VTARRLNPDDDAPALGRLIDEYPFYPHRNYRLFSRRRQAAVLRAEIDRAMESVDDRLATIAADGLAIAICRRLSWDTAWFGFGMAKLEYILRSEHADRTTIADAVTAALNECHRAGILQVTAKLDVADTDGIAVVEDHGFRLMDNMATYLYHPRRPPPPPVKAIGIVRPFVAGDAEQIMEITSEAYATFNGRFRLDPRFSTARAIEMYVEWARKCCNGERAESIFVAEDADGRLNGWASVTLVEPASSVGGARIFLGGLGACRPDRPGAYGALIRAAAAKNHAAGAATEAQTQNFNFRTIRVYESVGAQYVRGDYTFHAWLA